MKLRTQEEIKDKEIGNKKFARFIDLARQDNYNISDIHEYYDKFTFNITGIWFTFDKCVKNVENYYNTTIKLYQTILKEREALWRIMFIK